LKRSNLGLLCTFLMGREAKAPSANRKNVMAGCVQTGAIKAKVRGTAELNPVCIWGRNTHNPTPVKGCQKGRDVNFHFWAILRSFLCVMKAVYVLF